uniref:Uncharacterized protein n=1 Tax=Chromera velia CCMP2878 TaxID=1169474 RepID=A0A0G4IFC2_9ALVE|eukprot:Cvel_13988.t1-p1 / transcript=Cvel_13988.t1 / gene=Cvel_13988 / organism=Chromera_velia_CCMP2878 / gene_product=Kelch repeat-containing protein 2, putative / transcript_product=Kelch repeat-containing protein 2, putative / location=Cvel_scaffold978:11398-14154(+) / protein_length=919 / sequence_SO=supercontig / SO=protein_coding / is_pseudo=false
MAIPMRWDVFDSMGVEGTHPSVRSGHCLHWIPPSHDGTMSPRKLRSKKQHAEQRMIMYGGEGNGKRNDFFILERSFEPAKPPGKKNQKEKEPMPHNEMDERKNAYLKLDPPPGKDKWCWKLPKPQGVYRPEPASHFSSWVCNLAIDVDHPHGPSVTIHRSYLFVHGGIRANRHSCAATDCLDLKTLVWRRVFLLEHPPPLDSAAGCWSLGVGWLFGGKTTPEGVVHSHLWGLDLSGANFGAHLLDEFPELQFSLAAKFAKPVKDEKQIDGAVWKRVDSLNEGPGNRHSLQMCGFSGCLWAYGGIAGGPAEKSVVKNDLWKFDCKEREWTRIEPAGRGPGPLFGYGMSLLDCATELAETTESHSPSCLLIWGGENERGLPGNRLFVLDLEALFWSTPAVGGGLPVERRAFAMSDLKAGMLVVFGGDTTSRTIQKAADVYEVETKCLASVAVLHFEAIEVDVSRPPILPSEEGVSFAFGAESALKDAESLLLRHKKQFLSLEQRLFAVASQRDFVIKRLEELDETRRQEMQQLRRAAVLLRCQDEEAAVHAEVVETLRQELRATRALAARHEHLCGLYRNALASAEGFVICLQEPLEEIDPPIDFSLYPDFQPQQRAHKHHLLALKRGLDVENPESSEQTEGGGEGGTGAQTGAVTTKALTEEIVRLQRRVRELESAAASMQPEIRRQAEGDTVDLGPGEIMTPRSTPHHPRVVKKQAALLGDVMRTISLEPGLRAAVGDDILEGIRRSEAKAEAFLREKGQRDGLAEEYERQARQREGTLTQTLNTDAEGRRQPLPDSESLWGPALSALFTGNLEDVRRGRVTSHGPGGAVSFGDAEVGPEAATQANLEERDLLAEEHDQRVRRKVSLLLKECQADACPEMKAQQGKKVSVDAQSLNSKSRASSKVSVSRDYSKRGSLAL